MEPDDFQSLKEPSVVRWLSFTKAAKSIDANWPQLVLSLDEEAARNNPVAAGLLRKLKTFSFAAMTNTLLDVLPMNLAFQRDDVNLSTIRPRVAGTIACLEQLLQEPFCGTREQALMAEFREGPGTCRGQTLTNTSEVNVEAHSHVRDGFIQALIDNLTRRFPVGDLDLLQSLGQLLETSSFPQVGGELRNYGNGAPGVATEHYTPVLNPDTLR